MQNNPRPEAVFSFSYFNCEISSSMNNPNHRKPLSKALDCSILSSSGALSFFSILIGFCSNFNRSRFIDVLLYPFSLLSLSYAIISLHSSFFASNSVRFDNKILCSILSHPNFCMSEKILCYLCNQNRNATLIHSFLLSQHILFR